MTIQDNNSNKLEVINLSVSRSELPIFSPVDITLKSGQCLQIRGSNGAGKTTLLRAICGLCNSHEGEVRWNGLSIFYKQPLEYSPLGYVSAFNQQLLYLGHSLGLKPKLTVEQNLNFYRELRFSPAPELVQEAIEALGLGVYHDELVSRLSAGQKRRVALARIISEPAALWVLDEPMVALDICGQSWLEQSCNQHLQRGGCIVITSHQSITGIINLQELHL